MDASESMCTSDYMFSCQRIFVPEYYRPFHRDDNLKMSN